MELTLLQRAAEAERATAADEFRIISEAALSVFGWQDERYKRVLRMLEAGASIDAAMTLVPEGYLWSVTKRPDCATAYTISKWQSNPRPATASTPALALVAACLRSIAAEGE